MGDESNLEQNTPLLNNKEDISQEMGQLHNENKINTDKSNENNYRLR
jgi:hypothetical protein